MRWSIIFYFKVDVDVFEYNFKIFFFHLKVFKHVLDLHANRINSATRTRRDPITLSLCGFITD